LVPEKKFRRIMTKDIKKIEMLGNNLKKVKKT
jgi:hypothetical protein